MSGQRLWPPSLRVRRLACRRCSRAGPGSRWDARAHRSRGAPAVQAARTLPRGNGETVMIVDDERQLVALAEEVAAQLGYEPVGFDSSGAALEAFRNAPRRFDAVLTDESMPDMIGTELAREILRIRPKTPIILMSGYCSTQLADRAAEIGVIEVLHKPLHRRDLAESLGRVLGSAH